MTQEVVSKNEAVARRRISGFVLVPLIAFALMVLFGWGNYLSCPRRRAAFFKQEASPRATWGLTEILFTFLRIANNKIT